MDKFIGAAIALAIIAVAIAGMTASWRRRRARDSHIQSYPAFVLSESLWSGATAYVATTPADQPEERLAIENLAFRGSAIVDVCAEGVRMLVAGARPVFIPVTALRSVSNESWTIDRGVGRGGLLTMQWLTLGENPQLVASYLRIADAVEHHSAYLAINNIITHQLILTEQQ